MNGPRGMPTNGEKQFCDWLNHTRSVADVWAAEAQGLWEAALARRKAEKPAAPAPEPRRISRTHSSTGKTTYAGFDPHEAKHNTWRDQ